MSNLKVNAKTKILEFKRKHNELVDEIPQMIKASKDVISKIKMVYDENDNFTSIIFPKGIMPLSITINTHTLFIKNESLVNELGEEVEGYGFDGYYADAGIVYLDVVGNITEQIINELNYVSYDSDGAKYTLLKDTYHLFHPITSGGSKLYKHRILFQTNSLQLDFILEVINKSSDKIENSSQLYNAFTNIIFPIMECLPGSGKHTGFAFTVSSSALLNYIYIQTSYPGGSINYYREQFNLSTGNYDQTQLQITSYTDTVTEL